MIHTHPQDGAELGENMQARRAEHYRTRAARSPERRLVRCALAGALLTLALLGAASAAHAAAPRVPVATMTAWAVALSGHADTNIDCVPDAGWDAALADSGIAVIGSKYTIAGFVAMRFDDDGNVAGFIGDTIHMPRSTCSDLARLWLPWRIGTAYTIYRGHPIDNAGAHALQVLLHEAMHIRLQSVDEALVECTAFENRWQAVRLTGVLGAHQRALLWGLQAWHHETAPEYRTDC